MSLGREFNAVGAEKPYCVTTNSLFYIQDEMEVDSDNDDDDHYVEIENDEVIESHALKPLSTYSII